MVDFGRCLRFLFVLWFSVDAVVSVVGCCVFVALMRCSLLSVCMVVWFVCIVGSG